MSEFGIITTAGLGVGINTAHAVATGNDPFPTLFAGSLWIGACVLVGVGSADVGAALAGVYLLAVLLLRGPGFFALLGNLTKGSTK